MADSSTTCSDRESVQRLHQQLMVSIANTRTRLEAGDNRAALTFLDQVERDAQQMNALLQPESPSFDWATAVLWLSRFIQVLNETFSE